MKQVVHYNSSSKSFSHDFFFLTLFSMPALVFFCMNVFYISMTKRNKWFWIGKWKFFLSHFTLNLMQFPWSKNNTHFLLLISYSSPDHKDIVFCVMLWDNSYILNDHIRELLAHVGLLQIHECKLDNRGILSTMVTVLAF